MKTDAEISVKVAEKCKIYQNEGSQESLGTGH